MPEPRSRSCSPFAQLMNRRDVLRVGSMGVAATALPGLGGLTAASATPAKKGRAKSVILLWIAGGMTHHDGLDPKPDAPEEIRGSLDRIATKLPGIYYTEVMPKLAELANETTVIRTFAAGSNDHFHAQARALSGRMVTPAQITTEPNIGAVVSKLYGPRAGFPGYIAVPGTTRPGPPPKNLFVGGWLGEQYGPFPTGGKPKNADFTAKVKEADEEEFNRQAIRPFDGLDDARLAERKSLRDRLDAGLKEIEVSGATVDQYQGAFDMLLSPTVRQAFDLTIEKDSVREQYGRTKIGSRCLLARRLVESGARFVMVDYGYDPEYGNLWDNHNAPSQNFPHICEMAKLPYHLAGLDRATAALIADLKQRGLLEDTLVLLHTEFGRTPQINKNGGRDHWGPAGSILFAGGGTRPGQVIGATDKTGAYPTTPAYTPADVAATVYAALGIDLEMMLMDKQNRPIPLMPEGQPIPNVLA